MTYFDAADAPIPCYVDTDRPVVVGDRGACPIEEGVPGLVVSLSAALNKYGQIRGWTASVRYPNNSWRDHQASELHWVEPAHCVEVYLTDEDVEAILRMIELPGVILNRVVEALRTAVEELADRGAVSRG